jgi:hypothetical protein
MAALLLAAGVLFLAVVVSALPLSAKRSVRRMKLAARRPRWFIPQP